MKATRRRFLTGTTAALTTGAAVPAAEKRERLPREVWIASISQNGLRKKSYESMIQAMLARMEEVVPFEPDVICLPEVFPFANITGSRPSLTEVAEEPVGAVCAPFAAFAAKHNCHVVCPVYTKENGRYYNAAVFLDRSGNALGEYRKMHPTVGEMDAGLTPGPLEAPVFRTDFGMVGAQICFDIEWLDGWSKLSEAGAEIVFWPSAFGGGTAVNAKAWQNRYCVVSSTRKGTTKICDITGEEVAWTGNFEHWVCAPVNLEKAFLHSWPFVRRFNDVRAKYGRKVRIRTFHEEEWTIIESRSPDVKIAEVLREFELQTYEEHIAAADRAQVARREGVSESE